MTPLTIAIPTYRRPHLLRLLLRDLAFQTTLPEAVVVVDGDPRSTDVSRLIEQEGCSWQGRILYVPSNHANLAYQRYLGWKVAKAINAQVLLYLDDDLRVEQRDAVAKLLAPLQEEKSLFVGCTANILYPNNREHQVGGAVSDRARYGKSKASFLVRWFGASSRLPAGSLSPSGHRCPPAISPEGYSSIEWLRGGVMACSMAALTGECFSTDLFGLAERGYGHGEDTILACRLRAGGKLAFVSSAQFLHPCADAPQAYSTRARKMGFGTAYSRRLLNDNYRWPGIPTIGDRLALVKSYCGTLLINWSRALVNPKAHRYAFAWGYTCGALKGLSHPPTAQRLTPAVDWAGDAHAALTATKTISTC